MTIWYDGCKSPEEHMEYDRQLLLHGKEPSLRLYTWPWPSCTWGVCVRPEELLKSGALEELSIASAQRPTGGGLLFHGTDLAFSVFLPEGHPALSHVAQENYDLINGLVLDALQTFLPVRWPMHERNELVMSTPLPTHLCQAKATRYDLCWAGKKIGGCAERRTKRGLLHQTSLFVNEPDWQIITKAIQHEQDVLLMQQATAFLKTAAFKLVDTLSFRFERLILNPAQEYPQRF